MGVARRGSNWKPQHWPLTRVSAALVLLLALLVLNTSEDLNFRNISGGIVEYSSRKFGINSQPDDDNTSASCSLLTPKEEEQLSQLQNSGSCVRLINACWDRNVVVVDWPQADSNATLSLVARKHPFLRLRYPVWQHGSWKGLPQGMNGSSYSGVTFLSRENKTSLVDLNSLLQTPKWSRCTVPVLMASEFAYDFGLALHRMGSWLHNNTRGMEKRLVNRLKPTIVTPEEVDEDLPDFTKALLQPLLSGGGKSVELLRIASAMKQKDGAVEACFKDMLVCQGNPTVDTWQYGQYLRDHYSSSSSSSAAAASTKEEGQRRLLGKTLKVVFAAQSKSPYDQQQQQQQALKNVKTLIKKCSGTTIDGFTLQCSSIALSDDPLEISLALQNVDIMVAVHTGSGADVTKAFLLPPSASVIEVLPLDALRTRLAEKNLADPNTSLQWWHLYICDASKSEAGKMEIEQQEPRFTWPLHRSSNVPWEAFHQVLNSVIAVKGSFEEYRKVYEANEHGFYVLPEGKVQQSGGEDPDDDRCPPVLHRNTPQGLNSGDPIAQNSPSFAITEGMKSSWQVPAYPRGVFLMMNGCMRKMLEWWEVTDECPECQGFLEHVKVKNIILKHRYAFVAIYPTKEGAEYLDWTMDKSGGLVNFNLRKRKYAMNCFDHRRHPEQSVDAPRLAKIVQDIQKQYKLEGLPVYAAGFSSGGRMALMMPVVMDIQGVYSISMYAGPWLRWWLNATTIPYPPVATLHNPFWGEPHKTLTQIEFETFRNEDIPLYTVPEGTYKLSVELIMEWLFLDRPLAVRIYDYLVETGVIAADGVVIGPHYTFFKDGDKGICTQVGLTLEDLNVSTMGRCDRTVHELAYWGHGQHYVYSKMANEMITWLTDGGSDIPENPPCIQVYDNPRVYCE